MDVRERITKYVKHSLHYLNNAGKYLDQDDIGKSSEFLWGSFVEAIKAVALSQGKDILKHQQIGPFVGELSRDSKDKSIYDTYLHANSLHKNFYEIEIGIDDVKRIAEDIKATVGKLLASIPPDSVDPRINKKT